MTLDFFSEVSNNEYMKQKGNIGIIVLLVILVAAGAFAAMRVLSKNPQSSNTSKPIFTMSKISNEEETEVHHPDGTRTLIMHMKKNPDNSKIYTFFTADIDKSNKKLIFTKTIDAQNSDTIMELPVNTWTPGKEKYLFIEERSPIGSTYLVLQASGEPFPNKGQYLDVAQLFKEKVKTYTFDSATGWASPTLLIFTTKKENGDKGPSFWFEVPSGAFLQLAR